MGSNVTCQTAEVTIPIFEYLYSPKRVAYSKFTDIIKLNYNAGVDEELPGHLQCAYACLTAIAQRQSHSAKAATRTSDPGGMLG